jgi:hypothetical protein
MQAITFWVLLLALPLLQGELVQVIQLGRHGARSPNSFELLPNQYPEKEGELTVLGIVQQYFLGQEMRKRYVDDLHFLSEDFNSSEVVIKSSWKNRTMRSAFAFINGLYPQESGMWLDNVYAEEGFPPEQLLPLKNRQRPIELEETKRVKVDEDWARESIEIVEMDGDLYFHAHKNDNCPPAEQTIKELKKSEGNLQMEKFLALALYPQLASGINSHLGFDLVDVNALNLKKAKSVLDNYRCNSFHGKDHPDIDDYTLKLLKKSRHHYAYDVMLKDDMVRSIAGTRLLQEFLDYTRAVRDGEPNTPKFVFYAAHDTNLEILFSIFLLRSKIDSDESYNIIPFSSVLSIEVHKEQETEEGPNGPETKDAFYVKLLFNDEPQLIKWCAGYKCPLSQFHKILHHHMVPALESFCKVGRTISTGVTVCTSESAC